MASCTSLHGWTILVSALITFIISDSLVMPDVKTAIGVHFIIEPLLWELVLFILAALKATLTVGFDTLKGTKAALVDNPMSKGLDKIQFLYY